MKNSLFIVFILGVMAISSCISTAQFNNANDDVYYSPKASNKKQPVIIPEVDVDEIIKKNPPQYGQPTNSIEETPNPNAAAGYAAYKAQQDSLYAQNPRLSAYYIDPAQSNSAETQEAERLRNMYSNNYGNNYSNWNVGVGLGFWGPSLSIGYGNYNYGCNNWGYNSFYNPWYGYNNFYSPWYGGYGYNSFYNPWYGGYYGYNNFYSPWYGGGYYNPGYWNNGYYGYNNGYYYDNNGSNNSSSGNQPISRPRQAVGNNTPPAQGGNTGGRSSASSGSGALMKAPQEQTSTPAVEPSRNARRSTNSYAPTAPAQTLENVNGRQVYSRPAPSPQQQPQQSYTPPPAQNNTGRSSYQQPTNPSNTNTSTPSYSAPAPSFPTPSYNSGGSRSGSGGNSGGRSSSGGGGSSSGGGGRRR